MTSVHEETRLVLLVKGKRTKRQRSASPHMNAEAVSGVCSGEQSLEEANDVEFRGVTDEDEDVAKCLILLSRGHYTAKTSEDHLFKTQKICFLNNKKPMSSLGLGLDGVYQCKTCDKSFNSFQALGGHRTSHKKPKLVFKCDDKKTASASAVEAVESGVVGSFLSLQVTSLDGTKKQDKTHECSICKAEFSSGQALGGHMRRHRGLTVNAISTIKTAISSSPHEDSNNIPSKSYLGLDLNLPAPEDETKFTFASKDKIVIFAAATNSLIDCHH
ncbi:unnamed protein product [Cochlearia groenlandica]